MEAVHDPVYDRALPVRDYDPAYTLVVDGQPTKHRMMVEERVVLPPILRGILRNKPSPFAHNYFGAATYYRTYSREMHNGEQEQWHDTVIRAIEGMLSIRKDYYVKHNRPWDEEYWIPLGMNMATTAFAMRWGAPGRGWWAMSDYVLERGSMALNNCGYTDVTKLDGDAAWTMDALMCGVGVGFNTIHWAEHVYRPLTERTLLYIIPDDREGWVESVRMLINSYLRDGQRQVSFDYSRIRAKGQPIRGFGGTSAGYQPLEKLHHRIRSYMHRFIEHQTSRVRLVTDIMNAIGACVVAGNVRRSAEIALGSVSDESFALLKDYSKYDDDGNLTYQGSADDRQDIGWMSNNSVVLSTSDDFLALPTIADRIRNNGEPGIMNLINIQKFGRLFEPMPDNATGANPCAEIPLRSKELCNLAELYPTNNATKSLYLEASDYATIYASTVSLLPTHSAETNAVIEDNRRIGVSNTGIADWMETTPSSVATRWLRDGYKQVKLRNFDLALEAKVNPSIRITTIKPSGTVSQLANVSPGMHWHTFPFAIRRMRVADDAPITRVLMDAGVPHEPDVYSDNTLCFEFPVDQSRSRPATDVSVWQQATRVAMLQREWADNMVSNTIYFAPHEAKEIEHVMAEFAPLTKTMSFLPHTEAGAYQQMPYEGISKEEYQRRVDNLKVIDWSKFRGSDGIEERFCTNDTCTF